MNDSAETGKEDRDSSDAAEMPIPEVPIIKVDEGRARPGKAKHAKSRQQRRATTGFDAASLEHLVEAPAKPAAPTDEPPPEDVEQDSEETLVADGADEETLNAELDATVVEAVGPESAESESETSSQEGAAVEAAAEEPATPVIKVEVTQPSSRKSAKATERPTRTSPTKKPAVQSRSGKGPSKKPQAVKGSKAKRIPPLWIAVGAGGVSALVVIVLLVSLLGGSGEPGTRTPPDRSASTPFRGPQSLPTFRSDIPSASSGASGVRPMDAEEKARRREGMASFAEMGREEEAKLRQEETQSKE